MFHPDINGDIQPMTALWTTGRAPAFFRGALTLVRMMGSRPVSEGLRMAWSDAGEMRATLAKLDA